MSALIAGVDFSSRAIHAALVPLDADHGSDCPPVTLRKVVLPVWRPASTTPQYRSVERCRLVRDAMRCLLASVGPEPYPILGDHFVAHVCVEIPYGHVSRSTVLWELYGAILASIPPHIQRDTIGTQEWRRLVWPYGTGKPAGFGWKAVAMSRAAMETGLKLDEHEAESYLIATAARHRLDAATRSIA